MIETQASTTKHIQLHQRDAVTLPIKLYRNDVALTTTDITDMAVTVGTITKKYYQGTITYDSSNTQWLVPLDTTDTLSLKPGMYNFGVRFKLTGGAMESVVFPQIEILPEINDAVLN